MQMWFRHKSLLVFRVLYRDLTVSHHIMPGLEPDVTGFKKWIGMNYKFVEAETHRWMKNIIIQFSIMPTNAQLCKIAPSVHQDFFAILQYGIIIWFMFVFKHLLIFYLLFLYLVAAYSFLYHMWRVLHPYFLGEKYITVKFKFTDI